MDKHPDIAVLLAAGHGKRLLPITADTPKPLLLHEGRPVIDRIFVALTKAKIFNVVVVAGHLRHKLENYITENYSKDFSIIFSYQKTKNGTASALNLAFESISSEDSKYILVTACDYLLTEDYLAEIVNFHKNHDNDITVSMRHVPSNRISQSSVVVADGDNILKIIEKPSMEFLNRDSMSASLIYIVPQAIRNYLNKVNCSPRGEYEITDAVNLMITNHYIAKGYKQDALVEWEHLFQNTY